MLMTSRRAVAPSKEPLEAGAEIRDWGTATGATPGTAVVGSVATSICSRCGALASR